MTPTYIRKHANWNSGNSLPAIAESVSHSIHSTTNQPMDTAVAQVSVMQEFLTGNSILGTGDFASCQIWAEGRLFKIPRHGLDFLQHEVEYEYFHFIKSFAPHKSSSSHEFLRISFPCQEHGLSLGIEPNLITKTSQSQDDLLPSFLSRRTTLHVCIQNGLRTNLRPTSGESQNRGIREFRLLGDKERRGEAKGWFTALVLPAANIRIHWPHSSTRIP